MRERWKKWTLRLSPPGYDPAVELGWLELGGIGALIYSLCIFFSRMSDALGILKAQEEHYVPWYPLEMPYFAEILDSALWGFVLVSAAALLLIPVRAGYWYQGSRSIYLMRRLPQKRELWVRTAGLPLVMAALMLAAAAVLLLLYFAAYCIATPEGKQLDGQWAALLAAWTGGR